MFMLVYTKRVKVLGPRDLLKPNGYGLGKRAPPVRQPYVLRFLFLTKRINCKVRWEQSMQKTLTVSGVVSHDGTKCIFNRTVLFVVGSFQAAPFARSQRGAACKWPGNLRRPVYISQAGQSFGALVPPACLSVTDQSWVSHDLFVPSGSSKQL